ncbi:MAG TPA: non-canonical purine NTP pyrophosphatase [Solirubrobacteraceae bacterium]|nr:non-canonical purine NTP pyrophosphatase [Solirubrobacteraceae bacterium]
MSESEPYAGRPAGERPGSQPGSPVELVLATHNEHKRREFDRLLHAGGSVSIALRALPDEVLLPPEDADSFAGNALEKARVAAAETGKAAIADDSGICAEALGGAPGVRSARYAGEHASDQQNLDKLLLEAPTGSALEYVCVIAYVDPGTGVERCFEGRCRGRLAAAPRGTGGFGYDPAFEPDDGPRGATMAELGDAEKDAISHRGRAARALASWLAGGEPPQQVDRPTAG